MAKMGSGMSKPRCGRETERTEVHGGADRMDECETAGLAHRILPSLTLCSSTSVEEKSYFVSFIQALQIRGFLAEGKKCSRLSLGPPTRREESWGSVASQPSYWVSSRFNVRLSQEINMERLKKMLSIGFWPAQVHRYTHISTNKMNL